MRFSLVVATAILLVGAGAMALPVADAAGASSLSGMVCPADAAYGSPAEMDGMGCSLGLPGATVRLRGPGDTDESRTTDDAGTFRFDGLEDGDYTLDVARKGFASAQDTVTVAGPTGHAVVMTGVEVAVTGRVTGADGAPVAGAAVLVDGMADFRGEPLRTSADGAFALRVVAGYRGIHVMEVPGYLDLHEFRLVDGDPLSLTLQAVPRPDAAVAGRVVDLDGKGVAGVRVEGTSSTCCFDSPPPMPPEGGGMMPSRMIAPSFGGTNATQTDADGRYRLGVHAGQVDLRFSKEGHVELYRHVETRSGASTTVDVTMPKVPQKTARLEGRVVGADGDGLRAVAISVSLPQYGLNECSTNGLEPGPVILEGQTEPGKAEPAADAAIWRPETIDCAIEIREDGSFSGLVTPGYAIVEVYFQSYVACPQGTCEHEYYAWVRTMQLPADETTRLEIRLQARPGPDALVSGYVLDDRSGEPIPGAVLWFWNQDNNAYGEAKTDADGSYKVRVRSGVVGIVATVPGENGGPGGYLTWRGTLEVAAGETPFDVRLTPGEEPGACCWAYRGGDVAAGGAAGSPEVMPLVASGDSGAPPGAPASADEFEDLEGGLGPYDPDSRRDAAASGDGAPEQESPAPALAALVALLAVALFARRRRA
jgi:uncharacterized protein (TIGR03382 family)